MLEENSRRLQTLIERLLDFNRLSQQEVFTLWRGAPGALVVRTCPKIYRLALESKQISVHLPPEPISLRAGPTACDSSSTILFQRGQLWRQGRTDLDPRRAGGGGWLEVANEGPVIPPDERERIFEPVRTGQHSASGIAGLRHGPLHCPGSAMSLGGELRADWDAQVDVCFRLDLNVRLS